MRNGTVEGLNGTGRCLTVELLTGEIVNVPFEGKTTCNVIWRDVEVELVARGVVYPQIFGLAIRSGSDWVFVDPGAKLSKYYPNLCKEGKQSANEGNKPEFYCRVHFYLDALPQNLDVVSLQHYYLQLRQNLVAAPRFPPASLVQPLAYALQHELGDWRPGGEVPRWLGASTSLSNSLGPSLARAHQTLAGLGKDAARLAFIRAVMPQYNMHLFGMTLKTKEDKTAPAWIGVTPKGIEVYQNGVGCSEIPAQPRLTFLWANITKLYFERKKYGIHGRAFPWGNSTQKLSFTAASECVPQHLLHLCRSTHQFHLSNHKILMGPPTDVRGTSTEGTKGEDGGSNKMLDLSLWAEGLLLPGQSGEHQRVSVISNASSNTTSGIVSDRVYSLDGSEEDLEPDCCSHNPDQNSTSLESLSPRHPHHHNHPPHSATKSQTELEAKYWYCDSDCEDYEEGPCKSLLIRAARGAASTSPEDEADLSTCIHHNSPSMASETTLKGGDLEAPTGDGDNKPEEYKLEDEHVYGEISEEPLVHHPHKMATGKGGEEQGYSTILEEDETGESRKPKPKPRLSVPSSKGCKQCSVSKVGKDKCGAKVKGGGCCPKRSATDQSGTNCNGLTPKVASLKCLKKGKPACSSKKNPPPPPMNYVEFEGKLQQGRYPSTRTVSDNFDTDSDYVQLPPLNWCPPPRPPPKRNALKIWKCVGKGGTGKPKQVSPPSLSPPVNLSTLPRRKGSVDVVDTNLLSHRVSSKSTNAIHLLGSPRPEPPPKPRKSLADLTSVGKDNGAPVDARFIATKPQILIQTAYATNAPVAIPSQAQVLVKGEKVPVLQHSQSLDNIYDTVAAEEPVLPRITPPPYPTKVSAAPLIIRPNNYIDVHASAVKSKLLGGNGGNHNHYIANPSLGKNRCGSVPNNLNNNYLIGFQNLKPFSRTPIVHPGATSCLTLNGSNGTGGLHQQASSTASKSKQRFTTVYTNQLTRSQIQQFKAQLYSDLDYVIFPPKDPRVSQQEYFDRSTLSSSTTSNPMLQMNEIPPPYLPPPPPYPSAAPPPLPKKNPNMKGGLTTRLNPSSSTNVTACLSNQSIAATLPYHHNSFQSLYHPGSTASSSQYGYYTATPAPSAQLNSTDPFQRYLSTQSFTGSTASPIYYPSSTQSAPPLPPYKPATHLLIENGMRRAVQQMMSSRNSATAGGSEERLRMNLKLCRSEESLYSQPTEEEQLQAIYNLPPPPPYKRPSQMVESMGAKQEAFSAAELDLAHLRARCHALELPLLRALCSEGELLNKNTSTKAILESAKSRIRPTAHAHPAKLSLPPRNPNPLPIPPKPGANAK